MSQLVKWGIFTAVTVLFLMPTYILVRNEHWLGTGCALMVSASFIFILFGRPNRPD